MKRIAIPAFLILAVAAALILWERHGWVEEMKAQCESAMPFVRAAAAKEDVIRQLGNPSVEYDRAEWPVIEKHFGSAEGKKVQDIRRWLHERGRLMVYSGSNSVMLLYVDPNGKASHASCFLQ